MSTSRRRFLAAGSAALTVAAGPRAHATGVSGVYLPQVLPFADKKSLPLYFAFETAMLRRCDKGAARGTAVSPAGF